jgi:hypothetical protein
MAHWILLCPACLLDFAHCEGVKKKRGGRLIPSRQDLRSPHFPTVDFRLNALTAKNLLSTRVNSLGTAEPK